MRQAGILDSQPNLPVTVVPDKTRMQPLFTFSPGCLRRDYALHSHGTGLGSQERTHARGKGLEILVTRAAVDSIHTARGWAASPIVLQEPPRLPPAVGHETGRSPLPPLRSQYSSLEFPIQLLRLGLSAQRQSSWRGRAGLTLHPISPLRKLQVVSWVKKELLAKSPHSQLCLKMMCWVKKELLAKSPHSAMSGGGVLE
uniref:Uncharacterized protein n=1 Tax=Timema shepardi TaxID=629360 RepID=A0A7R9ALF0_TIMSH|nr:unnamed protein product [Timema shepardi]